MTEELTIRSTDGLTLDAALDVPPDPRAVLVFCHPHPQMGGTMNAPLLIAISEALVDKGWAVLRFNFRGVGGSEGQSGIGIEEKKDAEGAIAEAKERFPDLPLAIAGWSFGGAVAVAVAAQHPELVACVAIAPAVEEKPDVTSGLPPASEVNLQLPLLFLVGMNDRQVDPEVCGRWAEEVGAEFIAMPGGNHFFWGKYDDVSREVVRFLELALEDKGKAVE
ncbi:MAG: uncharacterized protein QOH26_1332 [Actinomycetota bacterium]|nr:uncharacterized protein [Actinomycetota bacterium]